MFNNSYFERSSVSPLPLKLYLNAYNGKQGLYILYKHFSDSLLYSIFFLSETKSAQVCSYIFNLTILVQVLPLAV